MNKILTLAALILTFIACSAHLHSLTASTTPRPGWTAAQVQQALGLSSQTTRGMQSGVQLWHYGVGSASGMGFGPLLVLPRCDYLSSSCMTVILHNGIVRDVHITTY